MRYFEIGTIRAMVQSNRELSGWPPKSGEPVLVCSRHRGLLGGLVLSVSPWTVNVRLQDGSLYPANPDKVMRKVNAS